MKIKLKNKIKLPIFDEMPINSIVGFFGCVYKYCKVSETQVMCLAEKDSRMYYVEKQQYTIPFKCIKDDLSTCKELCHLYDLTEGQVFACPEYNAPIEESIFIFLYSKDDMHKAINLHKQKVQTFPHTLVYPFRVRSVMLWNTK